MKRIKRHAKAKVTPLTLPVGNPNKEGFYVVDSVLAMGFWEKHYVGFATTLRAADNLASWYHTNDGGDYLIVDEKGHVQ